MKTKHQRVYRAIFENPIRPGIKWSDIENLLTALGAELNEREGSRVRVSLNDVRQVFHRPHPNNESGRGRIKDVRNFLERAGVTDVEA